MRKNINGTPDYMITLKNLDCQIGGGGEPGPDVRKDFPGQTKYVVTLFRQLLDQLAKGIPTKDEVTTVVNWLNSIMSDEQKAGTSQGGWKTVLNAQITSIVQKDNPKKPSVRGYKTWAFLCLDRFIPDLANKLNEHAKGKEEGNIDYFISEMNTLVKKAKDSAVGVAKEFDEEPFVEMTGGILNQNYFDAINKDEDFDCDIYFLSPYRPENKRQRYSEHLGVMQ